MLFCRWIGNVINLCYVACCLGLVFAMLGFVGCIPIEKPFQNQKMGWINPLDTMSQQVGILLRPIEGVPMDRVESLTEELYHHLQVYKVPVMLVDSGLHDMVIEVQFQSSTQDNPVTGPSTEIMMRWQLMDQNWKILDHDQWSASTATDARDFSMRVYPERMIQDHHRIKDMARRVIQLTKSSNVTLSGHNGDQGAQVEPSSTLALTSLMLQTSGVDPSVEKKLRQAMGIALKSKKINWIDFNSTQKSSGYILKLTYTETPDGRGNSLVLLNWKLIDNQNNTISEFVQENIISTSDVKQTLIDNVAYIGIGVIDTILPLLKQ